MSNRFDLLFLDEDGAPMAPVAAKKAAPAAAAGKKPTNVKAASESAPSKGRMEGDRKGKESNGHQGRGKPIESAAELPERTNRGPARRGGRQAASNQPARNYDRHSRMGNKEGGEKRQFGGKSGWGNPADAKEAVAEATEATAASPTAEDDSVVVEEAPANNFMTLEQYLAEQDKKKPAVAAPKARTANDGAKVAGEVVKKEQDMYFQTAKPVVNNTATKAAAKPATAAKATKFSLQELNAAIPGGLARPPRPVREESQTQRGGRQGGRRFENNSSKPEAIAPAAKAANLKDDRAFPSL